MVGPVFFPAIFLHSADLLCVCWLFNDNVCFWSYRIISESQMGM